MPEPSLGGIRTHAEVLRSPIPAKGGETKPEHWPEHCPEHRKGMEGLVAEARKHGIEEAPRDGKLRDVKILAPGPEGRYRSFARAAAWSGAWANTARIACQSGLRRNCASSGSARWGRPSGRLR